MAVHNRNIGVLVLNMGGPDSLAAVRPFLLNIFRDRMIIKLPAQPLLARIIAARRAPKVVERYRLIGGKSPIMDDTRAQAKALLSVLEGDPVARTRGMRFTTYVGMRYWHPFIEEAVKEAAADNLDELVVLPLFPQYSRATTGSCFTEVDRCAARYLRGVRVTKIADWHLEPRYLEAMSRRLAEALREVGAAPTEIDVVFSAHALPQSFVDEGDPYPRQVEATIDGILHSLGPLNWRLTYQSRSGPVKWMEPQTDRTIEELARAGSKNLVVVPISFVSDHIETLYEVDILYREMALGAGVKSFVRTKALDTDPDFIRGLSDVVSKVLGLEQSREPTPRA